MEAERIRIESPVEPKRFETFGFQKKPPYLVATLLFVVLLLLFIGGLALFFMVPKDSAPALSGIEHFSGEPQVYLRRIGRWTPVTRKTQGEIILREGDGVKTGSDSDVDLKVLGTIDLRLKPSSELKILKAKPHLNGDQLKLKLIQGSVLGALDEKFKDLKLEIETPALVAIFSDASFLVEADQTDHSSVSLLDGFAQVRLRFKRESVDLNSLEKVSVTQDKSIELSPRRVHEEEWRALNEIRDLRVPSADETAKQLELREKAGGLFDYVSDEGAFFAPNWSYAGRRFYEDQESGEMIVQIDYDVFRRGSYAGVYFKTPGLDLSKFSRLSFDLKANPDQFVPEELRVEVKKKFAAVRSFTVKPTDTWHHYVFDFDIQEPTQASEVVFLFENSKVGSTGVTGTALIKNLTVE